MKTRIVGLALRLADFLETPRISKREHDSMLFTYETRVRQLELELERRGIHDYPRYIYEVPYGVIWH